MILANVLALGPSVRLPVRVVLVFADAEVSALLGLEEQREFPLCRVPIGATDSEIPPAAEPPEEVSFRVPPFSRTESGYPGILQANDAGRLDGPKEARTWRRSMGGAGEVEPDRAFMNPSPIPRGRPDLRRTLRFPPCEPLQFVREGGRASDGARAQGWSGHDRHSGSRTGGGGDTMGAGAKLNKDDAPQVESMPGFEGRYAREDGYVLGFESFDEAGDFTPMYRGLPDDRCQSHHWGYVIKGQMIMHRPEGDIVVDEGEAYYVGPGHTGEVSLPGTEVIEFSPAAEYDQTMAVVAKNLEAATGGE